MPSETPLRRMIGPTVVLFGVEHLGEPCGRCLDAVKKGHIDYRMVMPLPPYVRAPLARDGSGPCCWDCAAADTLTGRILPDWGMGRTAIGNDRQDQLRLPGAPMGLVHDNLMRPSHHGDLESLCQWQGAMGYFDTYNTEGD